MQRIKAFAKWVADKNDPNNGSFMAFEKSEDTEPIKNYSGFTYCKHNKDDGKDDPSHSINTFADKSIDSKTGKIKDEKPNKDIILECWITIPDQ